jgi:hypothetical protein
MTWQYERLATDEANEFCACGGDGPADGCFACRVYHARKRHPDMAPGSRADLIMMYEIGNVLWAKGKADG